MAPVLIVVPSLVSGLGVIFLLVAILANHRIVQDAFLVSGVLLLWIDFFVTMAIFRHTVRNIDQRLGRLEGRIPEDRTSPHA